jgi:hypothetical protein
MRQIVYFWAFVGLFLVTAQYFAFGMPYGFRQDDYKLIEYIVNRGFGRSNGNMVLWGIWYAGLVAIPMAVGGKE